MVGDCPKEKVREVPASEILDKILKGEDVEYDCVIVKGDLDLSKLDLPKQDIERTDYQKKELHLSEEAKIVKSKIDITNSIIESGDLRFEDAIFQKEIDFRGSHFNGGLSSSFMRSQFSSSANFRGVHFNDYFNFFNGAQFKGVVLFSDAQFNKGPASFDGAQFNDFTLFDGAQFKVYATFNGTQFRKDVIFGNAQFSSNAFFNGAQFSDRALFSEAYFNVYLTFRDATFTNLRFQEEACRAAKMTLAKTGNRDEEEYHFYREMEAKRRLHGLFEGGNFPEKTQSLKAENLNIVKNFLWYDVFEYIFVQKIFGYGVHPWWLMVWWIVIIILFAITYWAGKGIGGAVTLFDYFKVSFATAIAPGYIAVIINPASAIAPPYQAVAILETIIGTFLWAGFIATFAKRYMR